ncbi:vacuolar protein sorting-associated protein 36 [Cylindrobasidium torrendii FP15055 ss-10]|uniref:Vacuolar protein-sorting-associated protein 36 n=1 Tax=Cylindrobasidium torrendii FP15055 ss-10 TaxID=1314674 RepID=A0A0D7BDP7_9AGAR|nr:vacuolar protein sorting-associated protein 36 [Cylindrobasidium torrendii FP15055 ss-10]
MALKRFTKAIDATIPVPALLYSDEKLLTSQGNVGIYDGQQKAIDHQSGTVHVSSHRLFFCDNPTNSFSLDLALVAQTDYYAGLFTSSAKITLHLKESRAEAEEPLEDGWVCHVCGERNSRSGTATVGRVCALCGVQRQSATPSKPSTPVPQDSTTIACTACTFLNPLTRTSCEICMTELPIPLPPDASLIKLSFRKGGEKSFYAIMKDSLKSRAWEVDLPARNPLPSGTGIAGILRSVENTNAGLETDMKDALHDLEGLMLKAKDMVKLAADLNEKLSASTSVNTAEPEEATFIRSSLSQLGLQMDNAPVTLDMMRDEREWITQLARELAKVLQTIMRGRGIVALDEVWGSWNRARGVALIPPTTFLQVLPHLPLFTSPTMQTMQLRSGLTVLHTPPYSHTAFAARLSSYLALNGPKTTLNVAEEEGMTIALAEDMIAAVEANGQICRDDAASALTGPGNSGGIIHWWSWATFSECVYDGQE